MPCRRQAIFSTSVSLIALTVASGLLRYIRAGAELFAGMPQRLACLPTQRAQGIQDHGNVDRLLHSAQNQAAALASRRTESLDTSLT
jgi:hypothetical protein